MILTELKGIGPSRVEYLRAMGIHSLRDLLYYFPKNYEDHTNSVAFSDLREGSAMVQGIVENKAKIAYFHGISRVTAILKIGNNTLPLCWFNEPWMIQQLPVGRTISLYGKIMNKKGRLQMQNPHLVEKKGWMPVYRPVKGIPQKLLREIIETALTAVEEICPETFPRSFLERHELLDLHTSLRQTHFPDSLEQLKAARRRLSYESMFLYLMGVSARRQESIPGWAMNLTVSDTVEFWEKMPYTPTGAQKRVLLEIAEDMKREKAMARLIQGDVGCGKTALAFGAIWLACRAGYQSAMMAPTEILAQQHYENACGQLSPLGIRCRLLTGSTRAKERKETLQSLSDGTCDVVFGTHALISVGVHYQRLGLVITDEQHRFGVKQRSGLQEKGIGDKGKAPHVLVMSATPIPRTLALILYGDLDLSVVDELPPGRHPVKTRLVPDEKRSDLYRFLRKKAAMGQQAYVVCPLVEDSDSLDEVRSAKKLYEELTENELNGLRVGLTWGRQKSEQKTAVLHDFSEGKLDVLVATTVIEVGVNVPNATVMIIENAERYGLSQLHQLRGRVGRGREESWCFLLSGSGRKLQILCDTSDGFEVARKDLELRGPGDLMGIRQSGESLHGFLLDGDIRLLDDVLQSVNRLKSDPLPEKDQHLIDMSVSAFLAEKELKVALN